MRNIFRFFGMGALMFVLGGCIENDIPYPIVKLDIVSLEA